MRFVFVVCAMLLAGCGGGGGGSSSGGNDLPPTRPSGAVSGTAFDGLIVDGVVKVYSFAAGTKGALLGEGRTDFEGNYSVDFAAPDQPVLIEITGGRYIEEASNRNVPLHPLQHLRAVDFYASGKPVTTNVTFFTHVATGLTTYLVSQGTPVRDAINVANTKVGELLGFNIRTTKPIDITNISNATAFLTNGVQYGFHTAAISQWTAYASEINATLVHSIHNSISFAQLAYDDVRADGKLDGMGVNAPLSVGTVPLNGNVYRHGLAVHLLKMVQNTRNKTGLKSADLLQAAKRYNDSVDPIFGGLPVIALDEGGPTISNIAPIAGTFVRDTFNVTADVVDLVGLTSIEYLIDGVHYAYAAALDVPIQFVNTRSFADGAHTLTIRATNILGTVRSQSVTLNFDNTAARVITSSVVGELVGTSPYCTFAGTFAEAGSGVKSLVINGVSVATNNNAWSFSAYSPGGISSLTTTVVDNAGNITVAVVPYGATVVYLAGTPYSVSCALQ